MRPLSLSLSLSLLCSLLLPSLGCTVRYGDRLPDGTPAKDVAWIDHETYPFTSHFLTVDGGELHYLDEGPRDGPVLVLVHGTPTWSFLYRRVIAGLADRVRCIAVDHIGFGLSSKPRASAFAYTPEAHKDNLVSLLDHLGVEDATMVVHDLGGPIGVGAALERPSRIAQIAVVNSFAWSVAEHEDVERIDGLLNSGVGEWLYLERNASPEMLLPDAFADDFELGDGVHRHYTHPFADETTRDGLLQIGRGLKGSSSWYASLWARSDELRPRIKLLVFGLDDPFFGPVAFDKWKSSYPDARAIGLQGVGHFPQEEAPAELIKALTPLVLERGAAPSP